MTTYAFKTQLRDGTPVLVRPVTGDDRNLIEMGMEHLTPKSRYMRFFRPVTKLSEKTLDDLTWVDGINHIAMGALDLTHAEPFPVGVARCIRSKSNPGEAEFAIAIIDSHQGRGLGTILTAAVAYAATTHGIKTLTATVLSENRSMLKLFRELGAVNHVDVAGVISVRISISGDPEKCSRTPTGKTIRRIYTLMMEGSGEHKRL